MICTDKTGTLTQNRMAVRELFIPGHRAVASPADLDPGAFEVDRLFLEAARRC